MNKKWPIRLYEDERLGILDLSLITRVSSVNWHKDDKMYAFFVYADAVVNINKDDLISPLQTMSCTGTDKDKILEWRSKLRDALIEYHTQTGLCRDVLPEQEGHSIDPISSIDLTQDTDIP